MRDADYARDNEAFIDNFAINALNVFQLSSTVYAEASTYYGTYQSAYTICQNHGGSSIMIDVDTVESLFSRCLASIFPNDMSNVLALF